MRPANATRRASRGRLAALLACSGASALVYQVLWLRLLGLVFGVTTHAATTVLAAFMGGLALGSVVGGRIADRSRAPLRWFGVVEISVAVTAIATTPVLALLQRVYVAVAGDVGSLGVLTLLRFVYCFAVLLVPTTAMGATMPLAIKAARSRGDAIGGDVSVLYAANTAGAVIGALLTGFVLIGRLGLSGSFRVAAALNVVAAVAAFATASTPRFHQIDQARTEQLPAAVAPPFRLRALVLAAFTLSGFVALALEIVWFRVLALVMPVTSYAFSVLLVVVLLGIALGSAAAPLVRRRCRDAHVAVAALQLLTAIAIVQSIWTLTAAPHVVGVLATHDSGAAAEFQFVPQFAVAVLSLLPTMLLMGAAFPLGLEIWIGGAAAEHRGRRVGVFYSANLAGSILGAVLAGFVLLPAAGSRTTLLTIALLTAASGLMLLAAPPLRRLPVAIAGAVIALMFAAAMRTVPNPIVALMTQAAGTRLFWYEEGVQTTASIVRSLGHLVLYLNGHHQADDTPSMVSLHRQIGHLPMAVHPAPRDALVIGLGGGATADAVSRHPGVRVDLVELAESVAHAARWFSHINSDVLSNPRVRLRVDDGRNHLLVSRRRYDVITADIIQPTHAGAGSLYSAEYFALARDALNDDGMMLQWIGQRDRAQYALIMRTFLRVFPHATVWADGTLLLGTKRPFRLNAAGIRRKLQDPETRAVYEALGTPTVESLLRLYTGGPEEARRFVGDGRVLTDDRPLLEYFLSLGPPQPLDITPLRGDVRAILGGE